MSFNNTDYLYEHLPSRFRREDKDLLLKRYLQFAGETLDEWDAKFDAFFGSIASTTADATWVQFWLDVLFYWSWFPRGFRLADKRRLYGNMARHLARRGTAKGIELWLSDFGIVARVHTRAVTWAEFVWGETAFAVTEPLNLIVEILRLNTPSADASFYGEGPYGEAFYSMPAASITEEEVIALVRYFQPHAHSISIVWRQGGSDSQLGSEQFYWEQISW